MADWGSLEEEAPLHPARSRCHYHALCSALGCPGRHTADCVARRETPAPTRAEPFHPSTPEGVQDQQARARLRPPRKDRASVPASCPQCCPSSAPLLSLLAGDVASWGPGKSLPAPGGSSVAGNGPLCSPMSWCVLRRRDVGVLGFPCLGPSVEGVAWWPDPEAGVSSAGLGIAVAKQGGDGARGWALCRARKSSHRPRAARAWGPSPGQGCLEISGGDRSEPAQRVEGRDRSGRSRECGGEGTRAGGSLSPSPQCGRGRHPTSNPRPGSAKQSQGHGS